MKHKHGAAFLDAIRTEDISRRHRYKEDDASGQTFRFFAFPLCIIALGLFLVGRIFFLQILVGHYYRNLSDSNRMRTTIIHAPRGIIFDRNGKPLVYNAPGFREVIHNKTVLLDEKDAVDLLAKGNTHLEIDSLRSYPYKNVISHVIGYIGQISPEELRTPEFSEYQAGDLIGRMGIEQTYEHMLKGIDGKTLIEVDATGKKLRTLGQTDPVPGQNITISLDANLQQHVFDAMQGVQKGAAIVSMPDGEILAMVSKPTFDPNLFTMNKNYQPVDAYTNVMQILSDSVNQPLLNRAISGTYPPGSTFKLVTAAAGLESGTIDEQFTVDDTGVLTVGAFSFSNWYFSQYGRTEGTVDIIKAIQRSNDIFFYKVGELLGVDRLSAMAKKFGLGRISGIDLPGEAAGLVPTKEWKKKEIGEDWYLGDDYHYGIGQGYLLTTPLQVNMWTQAIANNGDIYTPHLLKSTKYKVQNSKFLSEKTVSLIRDGMIKACSPGGVAWPLFNFNVKNQELRNKIDNKDFLLPTVATGSAAPTDDEVGVSVACKTGTAQHGGDNTEPHAWITLFAPAYDPQIIVTVLAEDSGEGSNVAAPIAKKILEAWFEK